MNLVVNVLGHLSADGDILGDIDLTKAVNELGRLNLWRGRNEINLLVC